MSSPRSVRRGRSSCGGRRGRAPRRRSSSSCRGSAPAPAGEAAGFLEVAVAVFVLALVAFGLAVFDRAVFDRAVFDRAVFDLAVFDPAVFDLAAFDLLDFAGAAAFDFAGFRFAALDFAVLRFVAAETRGLRRAGDLAVFLRFAFGFVFFRPARPRAGLARAEREVVFRAPPAAFRRVDFEGFLAIAGSVIRLVRAVTRAVQERQRGLTPDR
ncbi:MAG: hypothetical protein QF634_16190 [Vicinamibacterales bacterium]|jgi:hypothetical protein|nr:hypothetical protein [Vicinamibacterales bacterium]